jgi:hypothetical protein
VKLLAEVASLGIELAAISLSMILSITSVVVALIGVGRRKPVDQVYIGHAM